MHEEKEGRCSERKRIGGGLALHVKSETVSKLCEHSLVLREPGYKAKATYKYIDPCAVRD